MARTVDAEELPLQIRIELVEGQLVVALAGAVEGAAVEELGQSLTRVHEQTLAGGIREVVVDMLDLEFATSSSIKQLVTWLQSIHELEADQRYRVIFRSAARHHWQERSLRALKAFAGDVMEVA